MAENAAMAEKLEKRIDREVTGGLAVIGTGGATNIAPRNMGELMEFSKLMALSGPCIRPQFRNNPGACLAISLQAFRWGMDPIAVSNKAYITKSKGGDEQISYEAQLVHAVVNERAPLQKRLRPVFSGEKQNRRCKIIGHLIGEIEPLEYESPEIKDIAVKNSPLWSADPDQQLFYYSVRAWARRHVPEVLLGVYTDDEIEAQEKHYGPDNAKDVTPPRPTRSDSPEAELKPDPFVIAAPDGQEIHYEKPEEAATAFAGMVIGSKTKDTLDGLWESNTLSAQLRDRGHAELADQLHTAYQQRMKDLSAPADQKAPEFPASPLKSKKASEWPTWADWVVGALPKMSPLQRSKFLTDHEAEIAFVRENRQADAQRIDEVLDGMRQKAEA